MTAPRAARATAAEPRAKMVLRTVARSMIAVANPTTVAATILVPEEILEQRPQSRRFGVAHRHLQAPGDGASESLEHFGIDVAEHFDQKNEISNASNRRRRFRGPDGNVQHFVSRAQRPAQ